MKKVLLAVACAVYIGSAAGVLAISYHAYRLDSKNGVGNGRRATWFERDARLDGHISAVAKNNSQGRFWAALTGRTGVRIEYSEGAAEFRDAEVAIGATSVSARSLMDALAAMGDACWEYTERKTYRIIVGSHELEYVFIPREEREKERFEAGKPFLQALDAMPADKRAAFESGKSVPFTTLSPEMQSSVGAMLGNLSQECREKGLGDTIQVSSLPQAMFRLDRKNRVGFNELFLTVRVDGVGSSGWRLNDFEDQLNERAKKAKERNPSELEETYQAKRFDLTQDEARLLPELQRKVNINLKDARFPEVLRDLHDRYGIPSISDVEKYMPQRANVRITGKPLAEALDQLVEIYKGSEWEWRKMGFLIVRGPGNPLRSRPIPKLHPDEVKGKGASATTQKQ